MILALECDYCDDSESYQQIQFGNANNLRLMLSSRLRPLSRANAIIRPSMANRWPRLRIQSQTTTASSQNEYLSLTIWSYQPAEMSAFPWPTYKELCPPNPIRAPILRLTIFMPLALDGVPVCCPPVTFHPTRAALFRLGALLTD